MFKKTVLVHALTLVFGGAVLTATTMGTAMAQSNATGTVSGRVEGVSGASVALVNTETGLRVPATSMAAAVSR
jgi:hypothetical protein